MIRKSLTCTLFFKSFYNLSVAKDACKLTINTWICKSCYFSQFYSQRKDLGLTSHWRDNGRLTDRIILSGLV